MLAKHGLFVVLGGPNAINEKSILTDKVGSLADSRKLENYKYGPNSLFQHSSSPV